MKRILFILISFIFCINIYAQETTDSVANAAAEELAEGKKPVRDPWACNMLIDNQTTGVGTKGGKEFIIHHRFSNFSQKVDDLFGVYGSSNIRLGINYFVTDKIMVGFGSEKDNKQQEFLAKYRILDQTRSGSMPVSVALFGNACINTQKKETFGDGYKFIDKLSYFGQLIVSRKFTDRLSFQVAGSFSHFNKVESNKNSTSKVIGDSTETTVEYKNIFANQAVGVSCGGRFKVYNEICVVAEYNQSFLLLDLTKIENSDVLKPKPNASIGFEKSTNTHTFQLFVASSRSIIAQNNFVKNQIEYNRLKNLLIGFNITVRID